MEYTFTHERLLATTLKTHSSHHRMRPLSQQNHFQVIHTHGKLKHSISLMAINPAHNVTILPRYLAVTLWLTLAVATRARHVQTTVTSRAMTSIASRRTSPASTSVEQRSKRWLRETNTNTGVGTRLCILTEVELTKQTSRGYEK